MHLPENLRDQLRKPLGILIRNSEVTKEIILKNIPKDAFVISVGDATTEKMIRFGLNPSLQIVDSLEKRSKRDLPAGQVNTTLNCTNPAAQITNESISAIRSSLGMTPPVRIIVNGEEDLLVIPAIIYASTNSVVLYGQPNEGLVIVKITEETRNKAKSILDSMS